MGKTIKQEWQECVEYMRNLDPIFVESESELNALEIGDFKIEFVKRILTVYYKHRHFGTINLEIHDWDSVQDTFTMWNLNLMLGYVENPERWK